VSHVPLVWPTLCDNYTSGSLLYSLEINNRFGIEYYEHTVEAIFSGTVCVCVFRALTGLPIGPIWRIGIDETTGELANHLLGDSTPALVTVGAGIGLLGAAVAAGFASFHKVVMGYFKSAGLMERNKAVQRAWMGSSIMLVIAVLIPQSMFWGELEFQTIATASPAIALPHVFPTHGLIGFEMNSLSTALILGVAKMVAISFTVAAGFRGGFIFPFFLAGAAFGKALCYAIPTLSPTIATLCFAAGINVAITRTALATTLILSALAGEANALPSILASSMVSLFATSYMPFIRSQIRRTDIRRTTSLERVDMA
jgi:H+/Cl- antiporter ClcA